MKPISQRYRQLFFDYYSEKASNRFSYISTYSHQYINQMPFSEHADSGVDSIKIENFVKSYFLDVIKFKEYHFCTPSEDLSERDRDVAIHVNKMLNASKVGSFTAKWLLKNHPIFIQPKADVVLDIHQRQFFSVAPYILIANLTLHSMEIQPGDVPPEIYDKLIYHFRFRNVEDRNLILFFDLLCQHVDLIKKGNNSD